jgi:hypothetical protein
VKLNIHVISFVINCQLAITYLGNGSGNVLDTNGILVLTGRRHACAWTHIAKSRGIVVQRASSILHDTYIYNWSIYA